MKKVLLSTLALTGVLTASAQWVSPKIESTTDFVAGDTIYLYNTEAQLFLTQGNNWGSQASVAEEGLKLVVNKYVPQTIDAETGDTIISEWDGKTYTIQDYRPIQQKWYYMFIDSSNYGFNNYGGCFMDRGSQANYFWEIEAQDNGTYRIHGADVNPDYNLASFPNSYFGVVKDAGVLNTAVFPLIDISAPLEECEYYMDWAFVSQSVYNDYADALNLYKAAQALKVSIDDLQSRDIDVTSLLAVYNNTSSSIDEINEAQKTANQLISQDDEKKVTPDNPKDFTSSITNPDFADAVNGWTKSGSAKTFEANGWVPATVEEVMVAPALNLWGSNQDIRVEQNVVDVPNGIYRFSCGVYSQANGPFIFANDAKTAVTTGGPTEYSVLTYVQDNTINIGIGFPAEGTQWTMADCFRLKYYGNGFDAYKMWIDETLAASGTYTESTPCMKQLYNDYAASLQTLTSATTQEQITAELPTYLALADSMKYNVAAYEAYAALVEEATKMSNGDSYVGEDFDRLCDFATMESDPSDEYPYGSAIYILSNGLLTTEQITEQTAYLDSLIKVAVKNSMTPGADVTSMLLNPNFNDSFNGWSYDKKLGVPSPGGMAENPDVERWNQNFDFYQTVNLPNGVYRVDAQAFYRTAANSAADPAYTSGEAEVLTYLYANTNQVAVKNIFDEAQALGFYKEDNAYSMMDAEHEVPNSMKTASEAFTAGLYENSVYGVVYNGTLRLGIRSLNASITDRWSIWDNFRLTFTGFDTEIINACYEQTLAEAQEVLNQDITDDLRSALTAAVALPVDATDGRGTISVIAAIREAMANASDYVTPVSAPAQTSASISAIYTLGGQETSVLHKGINIIRLSDGTTKKVLIK